MPKDNPLLEDHLKHKEIQSIGLRADKFCAAKKRSRSNSLPYLMIFSGLKRLVLFAVVSDLKFE
jgi:hypothetical protein